MTLCLATLHPSRQPAPNITVHSSISRHRSFKTCPHFPRTAHRHRSSIQIRAAYSITARSASLGRPLTRCSADLLHLDQFSWTIVECRWHSKTFPRQQLPGPYSGSQFGITYLPTLPLVVVAASGNHRNSCNKISTCCLNRYSSLQRESFHLSW